MSWPLATDYSAAVQCPSACFADSELASGQPAQDMLGLPLTYAGNFANVYKLECGGSSWAVKCFTRQVADLQQRYAAISDHLERNRRKFAVEFRYLEEGIKVKGAWYPALKMRWVEGFTLNEFLREHAGNASLLDQLSALWLRLGNELRDAKMAHGDLQHGNVLLVPGEKASAMVLRLIDYDGMWVPELADRPPGEVGHPNYQHPQRLREGGYSVEIDRFAHLAIYTALRCLAAGGMALWDGFDNGENLLFKEGDFREPGKSKLWPRLLALTDPNAAALAGHLLVASQRPLAQVPLTAELLGEGKVAPLSADQNGLIGEWLAGSRPVKPGPTPAPPPPPAPVPDWLADAPKHVPAPRRTKLGSKPPEPLPVAPPPPLPAAHEARPDPAPPLPVPAQGSGVRAVVVVDPWAVPEAATEAARPTATMAALDETKETRPLPPPPPLPRPRLSPPARQTFAAPDWLIGVGLSPDSLVARYWPFCLGAALGLPLVVVLLWLLWPSGKPRPAPSNGGGVPPAARASITVPPRAVQVRGGRSAEVEFGVERASPEPALRLVVSDLPPGVRAEEAVLPPGAGQAKAVVRLSAGQDVPGGSRKAVVTLYRGAEKVDEKTWEVTTRQFLRPQLTEVSSIELKPGQTTHYLAKVKRNGNTDPLTLSVEPLPSGVTVRFPEAEPAGAVGLVLETDASAPPVGGKVVQLILRADGLMADQKPVALSVEAKKGNPSAKLSFDPRVTLRAGGRATLEVRLERRDYDGVVRLTAESLPQGVTVEPVDVPAGQDSGTLTFAAGMKVADDPGKLNPVVDVVARIGENRAGGEKALLTLLPPPVVIKQPLPKEVLPPRPEEVVVPTADGLRLKATYYPPPEAKKGPCVLMLPDLGTGGRRQEEWKQLALAAQKKGCAVLAIDFRGFGENLTSDEPVSPQFARVPANAALCKAILVQLKLAKAGRLQTMNQVSGDLFVPAYIPWLVQDVIAARLWLDLRHDREEINSGNLVLIAEGDAAQLGMIWLATEGRRYRSGQGPGTAGHRYEARDLSGAVWLDPRNSLRTLNAMQLRTAREMLSNDAKGWPPMLVAYDQFAVNGSAKAAKDWLKLFKQDGRGAEKAFMAKQGFLGERTLFRYEGAEKAVLDYVGELMKRDAKPWAKRDALGSAYYWHLGVGRSSLAKAQRATVPSLCPLNSWGFAGLKIQ